LKKRDELAQENSDPKMLREVFDEVLPQFSVLLDDKMIEGVAKKPPSLLPSFRYASPRLHHGDRTVILGDAIHTVKPYFGLGANSALEDVQVRLCITDHLLLIIPLLRFSFLSMNKPGTDTQTINCKC
jgi:2-polyprenyl-6-methoxyphenol hydroxylase-like FAD-dependent oxidoreductase